MTSTKTIRWIALAIGCLLAALSAAWVVLVPAKQRPLRIGINAWPGYEHLYLAKIQGHFKAAGLDVEIVEFNSLLDARRALERGQIDGLGTTATDVALTLGQSNAPLRIVQVLDYSDGGDVLVADTSLNSLDQLRGKRVGLEQGSVGSYVLARALASGNVPGQDITRITSDPATLTEDFLEGKIDAVVTYPPFSLQAMSRGKGRILFSSKSIPKEVVDVIAIDGRILSSRLEDVKRLLRGYWSARKTARDNPSLAVPPMAKREGITDSEFLACLRDDIRMLEQEDQAPFFGADGHLRRILSRTDSILRTEGLITGPPRAIPVMENPLGGDDARGSP